MEPEVPSTLENEKQFWDELDDILAVECDSHAEIDNVLRSYLGLTTKYRDAFLPSVHDVALCSHRLLVCPLFAVHAEYVRRQIVYSLLQEDASDVLLVIVSLLLYDGRRNEATFEMLCAEGGFVRLLELIQALRRDDDDPNGAGLHRLLIELMYEMSRIQRLRIEDLVLVEDDFVKHLFEITERLSEDAGDPYHYPVIRVLLVLNEQFMVSAHGPAANGPSTAPPTNKIIKILSMHGSSYKTFGENIILLLNREEETSLQLLTLKLLYLLFTTPSTYEYFYTNDLRVLVDILIRNLLDLPGEAAALRHTYLRVLHPLITHTQLRYPPHYKRDELRKLLGILVRSDFSGLRKHGDKILHFDEVDETTKRLVLRCSQAEWLGDEEDNMSDSPDGTPLADDTVTQGGDAAETVETTRITETVVVESPSEKPLPAYAASIERGSAGSPSLSVTEVATQGEKPGVLAPSKSKDDSPTDPVKPPPKQKPEPPVARRSRARRREENSGSGSRDSGISASSHQGRTLTKRTSFDRVAESEPPAQSNASRRETSPSAPTITTTHTTTPPTHTRTPVSAGTTTSQIRSSHSTLSPHPPAVPPPRRSSHSVPPPPHTENNTRRRPQPPPPPATQSRQQSLPTHPQAPRATSAAPATSNGHPRKPDPPKTRRWWTHQAHQQSHAAGNDGKSSARSMSPTTATTAASAVPSPQAMAMTTVPGSGDHGTSDVPECVGGEEMSANVRNVERGIDKVRLGEG